MASSSSAMGNRQCTIESTETEFTSSKRSSGSTIRKPFSDCTNTVESVNPSQLSSSSTKNSSSIIKPSNLISANTVAAKTLIDPATRSATTGSAKCGDKIAKSSADLVPLVSTPSRTLKPSFPQGTATDEAFEPSSVYVRRQSTRSTSTGSGKCDDKIAKSSADLIPLVSLASTPSRTLKLSFPQGTAREEAFEPSSVYVRRQSTRSTTTGSGKCDDKIAKSSADSVPLVCMHSRTLKPSFSQGTAGDEAFEPSSVYVRRQSADKRKRKEKEIAVPNSCLPAVKTRFKREKMNKDGVSSLFKSCPPPNRKKQRLAALPQDFIEQQRAYFAEVDAFKLSEEEVDQLSEEENSELNQ